MKIQLLLLLLFADQLFPVLNVSRLRINLDPLVFVCPQRQATIAFLSEGGGGGGGGGGSERQKALNSKENTI